MPRFKSSEQILKLSKDGEIFDENWMNYDSIHQYIPPHPLWKENRPIKFEDVDIWEVIYEETGLSGIYAAWCPYAHYFVVTDHWSIIKEFWGLDGEIKLQKYLTKNGIPFHLNKIWVEDSDYDAYNSAREGKLTILLPHEKNIL